MSSVIAQVNQSLYVTHGVFYLLCIFYVQRSISMSKNRVESYFYIYRKFRKD